MRVHPFCGVSRETMPKIRKKKIKRKNDKTKAEGRKKKQEEERGARENEANERKNREIAKTDIKVRIYKTAQIEQNIWEQRTGREGHSQENRCRTIEEIEEKAGKGKGEADQQKYAARGKRG